MAESKDAKARALISRIAATDDYYKVLFDGCGSLEQVLEVTRDADDDAIKKAYRKAALRLHPDKCQLEGSKEAFQKLSSAFACLSEPNERAYYDRTGRERGPAGGGAGQAGAEVDPDELAREIFKQMFGENFDVGDNVRPVTAGINFGTGLPSEFGWLFPIVLAVFFWFVWNATNDKPPDFSLDPHGVFHVRRETKMTQTPYFVDDAFEARYTSGYEIRKLEKQVDERYVNHLVTECRIEREQVGAARAQSCQELKKRGYAL